MGDEIRRRRTADPEMDALVVIHQALEELPTDACTRILDWARDRFVEDRKRAISEMAMASIGAQLEAVQAAAERLGVSDRQFIHAVAHVRSLKKLAPVSDDEAADETDTITAENMASTKGAK